MGLPLRHASAPTSVFIMHEFAPLRRFAWHCTIPQRRFLPSAAGTWFSDACCVVSLALSAVKCVGSEPFRCLYPRTMSEDAESGEGKALSLDIEDVGKRIKVCPRVQPLLATGEEPWLCRHRWGVVPT